MGSIEPAIGGQPNSAVDKYSFNLQLKVERKHYMKVKSVSGG